MDNPSIYNLDLHEGLPLTLEVAAGCKIYCSCIRVPGGWIYYKWNEERDDHESVGTFVPFDNSFQSITKHP